MKFNSYDGWYFDKVPQKSVADITFLAYKTWFGTDIK